MLVKEKLKIDNFYMIKIRPVVPKMDPIYGKFTGKTTLSSSQHFGDYSIQAVYVGEKGMALRDFFDYIREDTEILIFHPLKTVNPPELNEDEPIYVPITVIDYTNSEELLETEVYSFSISNIYRFFPTEVEKDEYRRKSLSRLKQLISRDEYFASESILINTDFKSEIKTKTGIARDEAIRKELITDSISAQVQRTKLEENQYKEYYQKRVEYEQIKKKYEEEMANINDLRQDWIDKFEEIDKLNEIMDKKEERLQQLYDEIKKYYDKVGKPIPPFDQLLPIQ